MCCVHKILFGKTLVFFLFHIATKPLLFAFPTQPFCLLSLPGGKACPHPVPFLFLYAQYGSLGLFVIFFFFPPFAIISDVCDYIHGCSQSKLCSACSFCAKCASSDCISGFFEKVLPFHCPTIGFCVLRTVALSVYPGNLRMHCRCQLS